MSAKSWPPSWQTFARRKLGGKSRDSCPRSPVLDRCIPRAYVRPHRSLADHARRMLQGHCIMSASSRPWFKFHPGDWRADQSLRLCSLTQLIATQLIATHQAIMRLQAIAVSTPDPITSGKHLSLVAKLTKAFALTSETLDRHRGKAGQKIVVERVNVSEGGQAIVGEVNQPAKEGT